MKKKLWKADLDDKTQQLREGDKQLRQWKHDLEERERKAAEEAVRLGIIQEAMKAQGRQNTLEDGRTGAATEGWSRGPANYGKESPGHFPARSERVNEWSSPTAPTGRSYDKGHFFEETFAPASAE
jgi:hypothetical protein